MGSFALWLSLTGASLRSQMQDRVSFVANLAGTTLLSALDFLAIWALFDRFGALPGWTLGEVALLYGVTCTGFGVANAVARGFDWLPDLVRRGDFDLMLLRPCPVSVQLMGRWFGPRQLGRSLQAGAVLGWALGEVPAAREPAALAILAVAIAGGACLWLALFVLQGAWTFRTVEGLEVANCLTFGGTTVAELPPEVYRDGFRLFFTWVVPIACTVWWPVAAATGRLAGAEAAWAAAAPLAGPAALVIAFAAWSAAVRGYRSAGG